MRSRPPVARHRPPLLSLTAVLALAAQCGGLPGDEDRDTSYLVPSTSAAYTIVGVQSNKCVEIQNASTALLAPLQIRTCDGSTRQQFRAEASGSGFRLRNVGSNLCADVEAKSTADGARLIQYTCGAGTNQQFTMPDVAAGVVRVQAVHSGKS